MENCGECEYFDRSRWPTRCMLLKRYVIEEGKDRLCPLGNGKGEKRMTKKEIWDLIPSDRAIDYDDLAFIVRLLEEKNGHKS